jgi:hypothetical protein
MSSYSLLFGLVATLVVHAPTSRAQERAETPEMVTRQFGAAMRANDWVGTAELMHPQALARFRGMFLPIVAADSTGKLCERLFATTSAAEVAALPDAELFARFFRTLVSGAPELNGMFAGADLVPVGHVLEGNDVAHVVFRMKVAGDEPAPGRQDVACAALRRLRGVGRRARASHRSLRVSEVRGLPGLVATTRPSATVERLAIHT